MAEDPDIIQETSGQDYIDVKEAARIVGLSQSSTIAAMHSAAGRHKGTTLKSAEEAIETMTEQPDAIQSGSRSVQYLFGLHKDQLPNEIFIFDDDSGGRVC